MHSALTHLEVFLAWLVRSSWQAAVLACLVLAAQAVFWKRLSPAWRYGLWMLVVARLLLPATIESRASVFNLAPAPAVQRIAASVVAPDEPVETVVRSAGVRAPTVSEPARKAAVAPRQVLTALWLGVVALLLARVMYNNFRFSSLVVRRRPVTNQGALDLLQDCKQEMGVHVPIDVLETPKVQSPSMLGFLRPRILLPPGMLDSFPRGKLRYFFLHELVHFKRGDILVNWLMTLLQILHWFNPFVWLAFSRMRAEREAACDACVVAACGGERESRNYGDAVVDLLAFSARVHWLPGVAGILEDKKEMKRRIAMISKYKPYPRWSQALAATLLVLLGLTALTDAQLPPPAAAGGGVPSAEPAPKMVIRIYPVSPGVAALFKDKDVKAFFQELGLEFPEGASIRYVPETKQLFASNTLKDLAILERVLYALTYPSGPGNPGPSGSLSRRVYTVPSVVASELEDLDGDAALREWFQNRGVEFPGEASVSYSASDRRLALLNTLPNLDRVGSVIEQIVNEHGKPKDAWAKKAICRMMLDVPPSLAGKLQAGDVTAQFTSFGVPFPNGASVHYDGKSTMIVVSNTTANLEKLRDVLAKERK